ncbi:MAG TPA: M28 family metallopeptidase [Candidatus Limnocylindrales bacterium]|nr:M28 family metallopeptidase [Candidatus Limnocylindrales bacterium]
MRRLHLLACSIFAALTLIRAEAGDAPLSGDSWWSRVKILADDNMEGRNTGSAGYERAAAYVAGEFERLGLKPAGTKDFYQPMLFGVRQIREGESSLALVHGSEAEPLSLGDDVNFGLPADIAEHVEAPAVFVAYGLVIPEMGINDLNGLDLKGKIAVYLSGGPKTIPGPLKAHYSHTRQRWHAFHQAGAIGMANISNPKSMDIPWSRSTLARLQPSMSLADPKLDDAARMKFSLRINPERADKFLAGTGHTFAKLLKLADADQPLPRFPLTKSIRARMAVTKSKVISKNVAAILPGSDSKLSKEYVVLSAHLDHLGIGQPINGDKIYNGAMDNASGVASLLEIAQALKSSARPRRSVLFLAVTGEEKGLQGSKYFANHPTVSRTALVADLNADMFLPIHALKMVRVFGLNESSLGDDIHQVCSTLGVGIQPDPQPDRNIFIRSDQYSFIRQGVPSLFFGFGYEPGSPEEQLHKDWLKNRYHAPSDDLKQPVDTAAAAQFNQVLLALAERVANDTQRPVWKSGSFFKRFAK